MYFPHPGCEPVSINKTAGAILPGSNRQKTGALLLQQTADGLGRVFRRSALPQLVGGLLHFRQQGIPVFRNQQAFYFLNHLVRRKIKLDQLLDYGFCARMFTMPMKRILISMRAIQYVSRGTL